MAPTFRPTAAQPAQAPAPGPGPAQNFPLQPQPAAPYPQQSPGPNTQLGVQPLPSPAVAAHPGSMPTRAKSKIDPDQIPSPINVHEADQKQYDQYPFYTSSRQPPPLPSTQTQILDEGTVVPSPALYLMHLIGNCSPHFMRSTFYSVPQSEELQSMSAIPFGLVIQPLADTGSYDVRAHSLAESQCLHICSIQSL
jgi:protein transport protein SEC24